MKIGNAVTNPGEMTTQVSLLKPTTAWGTGGYPQPTYAVDTTVWAKWVNVHGQEVWAAEAVQAVAPATILIRYYSGLDTTWRVRKGSTDYEIVSVDNISERSEYIELKLRLARMG